MIDETDYIRRMIDGETRLFSYFLDRYSRPVYSLIIQLVSNHEDAEELTQDTFMKAFRKLDTFKYDCSFSTWLYRIAYNTAISATRKKRMVFPALDEAMLGNIPDETVDAFFENDDEEMLQKLEKAIDYLNPEEKALITLYYLDEKSVGDVASILGLSVDNTKVKLFRVRKKLYGWIKSNDV
ncbi:RNA polymerase sigma factor [Microbacter margulisiae]|uniref:RNA polymerase sigma factor n=1 Tax=Microbacter margulisiae TaxID=1350067 RepID=A0A7W5H2D5_9PORP|nr:sigma-70 family RNA polymerase sigma factor [Microbacter margulisiae]MBB3187640.1 RNA polymerase sigma-70 factor (ECF subfamily) [Microbacter margulisiae]